MTRSHTTLLSSLFLSSLIGLAACQADEEPQGDELADELGDGEANLGKADGIADNFTYYQVRRDYRRCMYPLCGGYFVSRVNRTYTVCADGSWQEECYVPVIDWEPSGLPEEDTYGLLASDKTVLLRGEMRTTLIENVEGSWGSLNVSEAWVGNTEGFIYGIFTRVVDTGIRCITTPCPTLAEHKLNSVRSARLGELDLWDTGASDTEIEEAYNSIWAGDDGLIVAGVRYWFWDKGWNAGRYATQFFRRYEATPQEEGCMTSGCSGQYCIDESADPIISTCEWLPQYACIRMQNCERQSDGVCGFTPTEESEACFADLEE
jgi:hypothetical protein